MRTSLNEIKQAEDFLSGNLKPAELLIFRARLLVDPRLRMHVSLLKKTYTLIRLYGREKLRSEITSVHNRMFSDPDRILFQQKILQLFSNS
jgi:hypothetical protein